ncbi:MAG: hypothetical protein J6Y25_04795 [Elusimicrobiaceae bacterium]|nr:hypothetical protein [Elusimicrobiaceae bacterium]MBP5617052.1 hypothetical protein [Elusimicrobiaceae bacterium]
MKAFIINWCKMMFTQNSGSIHVRTATCQGGVVSAFSRKKYPAHTPEIVSNTLFGGPTVRLEENTIHLNRRECSFVNKEVHRLLRAQRQEMIRKRKAGIPLPPEPGKIAYAVYQ